MTFYVIAYLLIGLFTLAVAYVIDATHGEITLGDVFVAIIWPIVWAVFAGALILEVVKNTLEPLRLMLIERRGNKE